MSFLIAINLCRCMPGLLVAPRSLPSSRVPNHRPGLRFPAGYPAYSASMPQKPANRVLRFAPPPILARAGFGYARLKSLSKVQPAVPKCTEVGVENLNIASNNQHCVAKAKKSVFHFHSRPVYLQGPFPARQGRHHHYQGGPGQVKIS